MGYWESSEIYPDNQPEIWNSSEHCWTGIDGHTQITDPQGNTYYPNDLCGVNIRHHKFPDNYLSPKTLHYEAAAGQNDPNLLKIRFMGVMFENIALPKDNEGNDIPGIVGYEILRGSREGNRSIIAKGMINNFRTYEIKGDVARDRIGLYANYPFNDLESDSYLVRAKKDIPAPFSGNGNNRYAFLSPETTFNSPTLGYELKLESVVFGDASGSFYEVRI
jgi:hypothetical protein